MNQQPRNSNKTIDEQASAWFARLRANDVTDSEREQFESWRRQSEAHAKAYDKMVKMWALLKLPAENVKATLQAQEEPQFDNSKRVWFRRAAPLFLLLLIMGLPLPKQFQNWRSDYHTVAGEQLDITLDDGTLVLLNTDSALTVAYSAEQRRVELLRGEAYFEVESDKARPFLVVHAGITAKAVGTAFSVKAGDHSARVVVSEGLVDVSAQQTEPILLSKNQLSAYRQNRNNTVVKVDVTEVLSWERGQLVFNKQPLTSVINEVNRYLSGRIVILNPSLKQRIVSGVFDITDSKAVVDALTSTLHADVVSLADQLVIIY